MTCKEISFKEMWNKPMKKEFMSPFCGLQSDDEKKVSQHNSKFHSNKINFVIIGNIIKPQTRKCN